MAEQGAPPATEAPAKDEPVKDEPVKDEPVKDAVKKEEKAEDKKDEKEEEKKEDKDAGKDTKDRDRRERSRDRDRRDRSRDRRDRSRDRRGRSRDRDRDRRKSRDRRRDKSRSRSRSRDRDRRRKDKKEKKREKREKKEKKRGKWDDMGSSVNPMAAALQSAAITPGGAGLAPAQLMALMQQNMGVMPAQQVGSKKQRELYVGNLAMGVVTPDMLKETFTTLLQQVPEIGNDGGTIVVNAQLSGEGRFAFVEFRNEEIAQTALQFAGIDLCGRQLKIGRPSNYVAPLQPVKGYSINREILGVLGASGAMQTTPEQNATKKQRELYVGNLAQGMVTVQMLKDLFNPPLLTFPNVKAEDGPPVVTVSMDGSQKFAFVEFRTQEIADTAMGLFEGMDLCQRPLRVRRPTGWVDPKAAAGMGMMGMAGMAGMVGMVGMAGMGMMGMAGMAGAAGMPIMGMPGTAGAAAGAGAMAMAAVGPPSSCILLENLVSEDMLADDEEYADVSEDIRVECASKGTILQLLIPRTGEHAKKVFVKFAAEADATKALESLNGRSFAENKVVVSYIKESDIPTA